MDSNIKKNILKGKIGSTYYSRPSMILDDLDHLSLRPLLPLPPKVTP